MMVGATGHRFIDETIEYSVLASVVNHLPRRECYGIFDESSRLPSRTAALPAGAELDRREAGEVRSGRHTAARRQHRRAGGSHRGSRRRARYRRGALQRQRRGGGRSRLLQAARDAATDRSAALPCRADRGGDHLLDGDRAADRRGGAGARCRRARHPRPLCRGRDDRRHVRGMLRIGRRVDRQCGGVRAHRRRRRGRRGARCRRRCSSARRSARAWR